MCSVTHVQLCRNGSNRRKPGISFPATLAMCSFNEKFRRPDAYSQLIGEASNQDAPHQVKTHGEVACEWSGISWLEASPKLWVPTSVDQNSPRATESRSIIVSTIGGGNNAYKLRVSVTLVSYSSVALQSDGHLQKQFQNLKTLENSFIVSEVSGDNLLVWFQSALIHMEWIYNWLWNSSISDCLNLWLTAY